MKIKAFTLIELLIVISIIIILSTSWWVVFFDFLNWKEVETKVNKVINLISTEDSRINNNEIFDYKIFFNKENNSFFYLYENSFNWDNSIIYLPKDWKLKLSSLIEDEDKLEINIFENWKFKKSNIFTWSSLDFTKDYNINYEIESSIIENNIKKQLNKIKIKNYEDEYDKNNYLKLEDIVIEDSNEHISNLEIENIWWKKEFYNNWIKINNKKIVLYFEKNWITKFIVITKK